MFAGAAATVLEELAYYTPGVASALYDGQALLVGRTLDAAPAHIRCEYLSRLVRGEIVGSFATSEPDASTDLSADAMRTTATRVAGGYRLNGRKRWITNSCAADIMTTLCVVDGEHAMLLVDMHSDAVVVGAPDKKMGNRLQLTSDVELIDVFVPDDHVIAEPGRGLAAALKSLPLAYAECLWLQAWRISALAIPDGRARDRFGGRPLPVPKGGAQVRHPRLG
jgi:alkylation response protein AidB-like acyl-CoA dehydrogenase